MPAKGSRKGSRMDRCGINTHGRRDFQGFSVHRMGPGRLINAVTPLQQLAAHAKARQQQRHHHSTGAGSSNEHFVVLSYHAKAPSKRRGP